MEQLLEPMKAQLAVHWARRHEMARRLREEDAGFATVEVVLWVLCLSTLATVVGAIIYALVVAKAKSIHF